MFVQTQWLRSVIWTTFHIWTRVGVSCHGKYC